jgi:hypothetical protein
MQEMKLISKYFNAILNDNDFEKFYMYIQKYVSHIHACIYIYTYMHSHIILHTITYKNHYIFVKHRVGERIWQTYKKKGCLRKGNYTVCTQFQTENTLIPDFKLPYPLIHCAAKLLTWVRRVQSKELSTAHIFVQACIILIH